MTTVELGAVATRFPDNAKVGELETTVAGLDEPTLNRIRRVQAIFDLLLMIWVSKVMTLPR